MTGLEKIIQKIESDGREKCSAVLADARAKAEEIVKSAKEDGKRLKAERIESAQKRCGLEAELARSTAETKRNKAALGEKVEIIGEVIAGALEKFKNLPAKEYFPAIKKLAAKYAMQGQGVMLLSKADLERLPSGFEEDLNKALGKGRSIKIGGKPADIDGGFILSYEGMEQNCSLSSLFEDNLDRIKDAVSHILFSEESA